MDRARPHALAMTPRCWESRDAPINAQIGSRIQRMVRAMRDAPIIIEHLVRDFGDTRAVDDAGFAAEAGTVLGLR